MTSNVPLGRILGIKVGMSWSVLAIAALYVYVLAAHEFPNEAFGLSTTAYWVAGVVAALAFFASLLVHEMSHALVARRAGIGVRGITLWLLGGFAELEDEPSTPGMQFLIAAAGPVSNIALGGLFWLANQAIGGNTDPFAGSIGNGGLVSAVLAWLAFVNLLIGAFNLLPAAPLDGGQLFSAGLWAATGNRNTARRWSAYTGIGLGALAIFFGVSTLGSNSGISGIWFVLIGWWVISAAQAQLRQAGVESKLGGATLGQLMRPEPPILPGRATIDQAIGPHALDGHPDAYCVQGEDGRITGLLTAAQVAHTDHASRTTVPMANLAFPIDRVVCAVTSDPALPTLRRLADAAVPLVLVVWPNGRVAGTVGEPELRLALAGRPPLAASRADRSTGASSSPVGVGSPGPLDGVGASHRYRSGPWPTLPPCPPIDSTATWR